MSPTVTSFPSDDNCGANYQRLINETKFATLYQLTNDGVLRYNESGYVDATEVPGANRYNYTSRSRVTYVIKPIFYSALPWKGNCSRVYAWLSLPSTGQTLNPVPGVVLLHGGGGTAFKAWCEEWALRDMSSIAISLEGQTDVKLVRGCWYFGCADKVRSAEWSSRRDRDSETFHGSDDHSIFSNRISRATRANSNSISRQNSNSISRATRK